MKKIYSAVYIQTSPVIELLAAMFRAHCHEQLRGELDYVPNELQKWVEKTRASLSEEMKSSLEIFFNFESFFGLTLVHYILEYQHFDDIETFLDVLKEMTPKELISHFLTSGYESEQEVPSSKESIEVVSKYIKKMNLPDVEKWKLTYLFANSEEAKHRFIQLVEEFYTLFYLPEKEKLTRIHQESCLDLEKELQHDLSQKISALTKVHFDMIKGEEKIIFVPSYFYDISSLHSERDKKLLFVYGIRSIEKILHQQLKEGSIIEGIKALADENRIKILKILNAFPCSGYELAQRLGLSNSTISHHISILTSRGLITMTKHDRKKVYTVNKIVVERVLESMSDYLSE